MQKTICFACSVLLAAALHAETVSLGSHGSLEIVVPAGWKLRVEPIGDEGCNLKMSPAEDINALCLISIMFPPNPRPIDKGQIDRELREACSNFVSMSVEQQIIVHPFELAEGYGLYATLTDASLAGKPPKRGDFKVMTNGLIQFSDDVMAVVNVLTDDEHCKEQGDLMRTVSGLKFRAAR